MNILILSVGTRNKIIQYFKENIGASGKIIATDMSSIAPAIYDADKYYLVPRITEEGYIDVILDICKKENINAVLSLIDPELSLLAKHNEDFAKLGVIVIGSEYSVCEMALNKYKMYEFCVNKGYNCAKSWLDIDEFIKDLNKNITKFPVFVKPIKGSASILISKVENEDMLRLLFKYASTPLMIQEFLDGQEIGVDCYIDMISNEVVSIFAKKKLVMRAGETDKSVSFKDNKLFDFVIKFVNDANFKGQIDIDIFDINGKYYISEVNPRFGGGYPHAYECGCNHMELIVNNINGIVNEVNIGNYSSGKYMMKYNEIVIK